MAPKKQWINKKSATTYQLFHRSQNDPLIHDPEAQDRILFPVSKPRNSASSESGESSSSKPIKHLADLEQELDTSSVRKNEGEAANYGIFYDDTRYDYMQHLRELGGGGGNSYFIEVAQPKAKGKGKKLEDALRDDLTLDDSVSEFGGASVYGSEYGSVYDGRSTASSYVKKPTYQDQQDVPDVIAGFKPDMDPRLREVLEALEDEAYVDEDDDIFGDLTKEGEEVDPAEWEDSLFDNDDEDDGWESDATEKAPVQKSVSDSKPKDEAQEDSSHDETAPGELPSEGAPVPDMKPEDGDWMREFAKFKKDSKSKATAAAPTESERRTAASTMFTAGGTPVRRKKRKGAMTNPSAYSMTSSSLARTEGLRLLDDRFEKVEALYSLDEEGEEYEDSMSMVSGMTGMTGVTGVSHAPSFVSQSGNVPLRSDFDDVMDSFLSGWTDRSKETRRKGAKAKRGKNGNEAIGIKMLDEVRQGLGPARVPGKVSGNA
ncbi:low-temperature viability protein ltv1 [Paecilomyces variotii No. 5]|uniref:Low-temperature viability protein ltv1 n=1 Tax=Byssochlamys spectabilis (strain No. 5 / NBRC 109023) TaxID=1356009 RepID=V5FTM5_BYSSN|nr:low-temperature viability protein ltv1 [Paecilomyces variotii No. 5]